MTRYAHKYVVKAHDKYYRRPYTVGLFWSGYRDDWTTNIDLAEVFSDDEYIGCCRTGVERAKRVARKYAPCAEVVEVKLSEGLPN